MGTFEIRDQFYLNGKPFKIISGGIHYFRVLPEQWMDRLIKLKALGCNTVETYIPWNMHEMEERRFVFSGGLDIVAFVQMAREVGLYVILRPSPYICAEWEFGGLPAWLLAKDGMEVRSSEGPFLSYVRKYYETLLPLLTPLQIDQGGPVILMQVENEYGYYGDDTRYLEALRDMMREMGVTVPLVTSDGPQPDTLAGGSVEGALPTANFGSGAEEKLATLARHIGNRPLMCMEFWVGWFDSWGCGEHHTTDVEASARELRAILEKGSVNIYMFLGGTNFGFMNGANYYDALTPDVTSYDYDALLTEDGRITEKYLAFQRVIRDFLPADWQPCPLPEETERSAYPLVEARGSVSLFAALETITMPRETRHPFFMEQLGQGYGYVLYRTALQQDTKIENFRLWKANDRAQMFWNRKHTLTLYDRELLESKEVDWVQPRGAQLDILVENMGRVNYGVRMREQRKGIAGDVLLNGHFHSGWKQYSLPMDKKMLAVLCFEEDAATGMEPAFFRFVFDVDEPADTFLDMTGWGKGCAFIGDTNIGRFWEIGPQKRLYVPVTLLRKGKNECIIFETEGKRRDTVSFVDTPCLG